MDGLLHVRWEFHCASDGGCFHEVATDTDGSTYRKDCFYGIDDTAPYPQPVRFEKRHFEEQVHLKGSFPAGYYFLFYDKHGHEIRSVWDKYMYKFQEHGSPWNAHLDYGLLTNPSTQNRA